MNDLTNAYRDPRVQERFSKLCWRRFIAMMIAWAPVFFVVLVGIFALQYAPIAASRNDSVLSVIADSTSENFRALVATFVVMQALLAAPLFLYCARRTVRESGLALPPDYCGGCGYTTEGITAGNCPECGASLRRPRA